MDNEYKQYLEDETQSQIADEKRIENRDFCEHELTIVDEFWYSNTEVEVSAECGKCFAKFLGKLKQ